MKSGNKRKRGLLRSVLHEANIHPKAAAVALGSAVAAAAFISLGAVIIPANAENSPASIVCEIPPVCVIDIMPETLPIYTLTEAISPETSAATESTTEAQTIAQTEPPVIGFEPRADIPLGEAEQEALFLAAQEFDVPHELALAVVWRESNFRNVNGDGGRSVGFMQIQPRWFGDLMQEIGADDLTEPGDNFRTGCAILGDLIDRYDGDLHRVCMSYNMGAAGAAKARRNGNMTSAYSRSVIEYMENLQNG